MHTNRQIGFLEAFSIGVGGMVGGGIFAVLGLTIDLAKGAAPISFAIAGFIALVTVYSYVKLSLRYPSEGGTIEFIVQAFGNGMFSAFVNNLMLISYVIMIALYAYAFGSYGSALFLGSDVAWLHKVLAVGVIVVFTFINLLGAYLTGKAEDIMVLLKIAILLLFCAVGFVSIDFSRMSPQYYESIPSIVTGGLIIFLAYEGFELIANTARDVKEPHKNLPRAYYSAVIFVIALYVLVAVVTIGNVSFEEAKKAQDYVLAIAAKPFFGEAGFVLIGVAAVLSTASAINATIYGSGRTAFLIAKLGEIPQAFEKKIKYGFEGMIIIALLAIIFTLSFDIENISIAGSIGFLIIFALVNLANFRLYKETGGCRLVSGFGFLLSLSAVGVLVWYNALHSPQALKTSLIAIFTVAVFVVLYYVVKKENHLAAYMDKDLQRDEEIKKLKEKLDSTK